jgi:crotonobetainyl-CoA:carnitine CoA-transferase CaiB-like acyl-CoA transferase
MKPLEGLRILSVEVWGAGPYGSQLLAAHGADNASLLRRR